MLDWILAQEGLFIYVGLFLSLLGGAVGLPIPEDLPLIIGGVLANQGNAELHLIFIVCYTAIIIGDVLIFFIGRKFGPALFTKEWVKKRMPPSRVRKMRFNLEKRSLLMIFLARHLFYLRTITFLTCGAVKMRVERFLLADACAALVSVPLMLTLGYFAAEHYESMFSVFRKVEYVILVGIIIAVYIYWKKKKAREALDREAE
jgi:membrane protein DedA with SNARE-associated domain